MATLCCDYYAECGVRDRRLTTIGAAKSAPSVERALLETVFEPTVMMRLPLEDRPGVQFAPEVAMFCFPVRDVHVNPPNLRSFDSPFHVFCNLSMASGW